MSAGVSDIGIIIHQVRFGEADKFVRLLSKDHGLVEVIAKGVRKLTSKKSSHLDNLNLVKFQTNRGESPQYLSQVETLNYFGGIKSNLKKVRTCFYLCEVLDHYLMENQPDTELFISFRNFLSVLDKSDDNYRDLATQFQLYLIDHLGFQVPGDTSPESLIKFFENLIEREIQSTKIKIR